MTDAAGKAAVSGIYTTGAGLTKSCVDVASTLTAGIQDTSTYSVSLKRQAQFTERLVTCRRLWIPPPALQVRGRLPHRCMYK